MASLVSRWPSSVIAVVIGLGAAGATGAATPAQIDAIKDAARCMIYENRRSSATLSAAIPGSDEESAAWTALAPAVRRCFAGARLADSLETRQLVAGQIAERLYLESNSSFQSRVVSTSTADAGTVSLTQAVSIRTREWPREAAVAECVVATSTNNVDRLLRSRPGSRQETGAIEPIVAALPACLDAGQELAIDRVRLRAELARAFYRYIYFIRRAVLPNE